MRQSHRSRGMGVAHGAINAGLALIIVSISGLVALIGVIGGRPHGAAGKPKMHVLPGPIGVGYRQTVEVEAQNLRKFAENQRVCDSKHDCTLAVADADPSKPAYYIATDLHFSDQKPLEPTTTRATTTTTRATTTTTRPFVSITARGSARAGPNGGSASAGGSVSVEKPLSSETALPPYGSQLDDALRPVVGVLP
jgi:hypothetical protein